MRRYVSLILALTLLLALLSGGGRVKKILPLCQKEKQRHDQHR